MRILMCICAFVICANANGKWDYGMNMQEGWANADLTYRGCKEGNQQSPINIATKNVRQGALEFVLKYLPAKGVNVELKDYVFTITYPQGSYLEFAGRRYHIKKIYFHTPAENGIDSKYYQMEMQIFHEDSKGNKLFLSVLFTDGSANETLGLITKNLPTQEGKAYFVTNFDINKLIPNNLASYQFYGSLTTPPCSQNVQWLILKTPMPITKTQLDSMQNITKQNARTTQELFNRLVVE